MTAEFYQKDRDHEKVERLAEQFRRDHDERLRLQKEFGHKTIAQWWRNKATGEIVEVLQYNCVDGRRFEVVFWSPTTWYHPVHDDEKTFREEFEELSDQKSRRLEAAQ